MLHHQPGANAATTLSAASNMIMCGPSRSIFVPSMVSVPTGVVTLYFATSFPFRVSCRILLSRFRAPSRAATVERHGSSGTAYSRPATAFRSAPPAPDPRSFHPPCRRASVGCVGGAWSSTYPSMVGAVGPERIVRQWLGFGIDKRGRPLRQFTIKIGDPGIFGGDDLTQGSDLAKLRAYLFG